jgi:hypothetical protein
MREPAALVEIVRTPGGEAPEWVRQAWIGLRLPLVDAQPTTFRGAGVLTGPVSILGYFVALLRGRTAVMTGYLVNAKVAVDLLAAQNRAAADWWQTGAARLLDGRQNFGFDVEACRVVTPTEL